MSPNQFRVATFLSSCQKLMLVLSSTVEPVADAEELFVGVQVAR